METPWRDIVAPHRKAVVVEEQAFEPSFLEELLNRPVMPQSDLEKLLTTHDAPSSTMTRLEKKRWLVSLLVEPGILVAYKGGHIISPLYCAHNEVWQGFVAALGGVLRCPLCNSAHKLTCPRCRWEISWI